jgi:hypothetical protein
VRPTSFKVAAFDFDSVLRSPPCFWRAPFLAESRSSSPQRRSALPQSIGSAPRGRIDSPGAHEFARWAPSTFAINSGTPRAASAPVKGPMRGSIPSSALP